MPRTDLLALSLDDLATLTNRGTVKRAQREIEANEFTGTLAESDTGDVTATWSDGVECRLPAGGVVRDAQCSCAAVGLCRHLIRTVLAYQKQSAAETPAGEPPAPGELWDPGAIADEELAKHYRPAALAKVRAQFEQGILAELVRSGKPTARFHLQSHTVRFLVPGDPRYTHCDCAEAAPCSHVPLAVWAFRQLAPERSAGILATGAQAPAAPVDLLDELESAVLGLVEQGVSGVALAWVDRLTRLEERCRQTDLVWPAEILSELAQQQERYAAHDARFAPERVANLAGELLIRSDAIRNDSGALPQLLIRGARADRPVVLGAARLIGLGCGVRVGRRSVELTAYLQDSDSGSVVAVVKDMPEGDPAQPPRPFADLAQTSAVKRSSFAALGTGQLLIRGAKRTAGFQLLPGRADASVQPQAFAWESLRPPVLAEEFGELDARLSALPPASLRPRRVAEDFHVCGVASVEEVHFDAPSQSVQAVLLDARGQRAFLVHPYTSRGAAGAEALLALLGSAAQGLRFVSGQVRRSSGGLVVHPVCLVWQEGDRRIALQPWVDRRPEAPEGSGEHATAQATGDPLSEYLRQLQTSLGDLFVLGLTRADALLARRWRDVQRQGGAVGFTRLATRAAALADALEQKGHTLHWDWQPGARIVLELAVLLRMAHDLASF